MQRALVHFSGGNYDEFVVRDQHLRCFIRRANTADLLKNTEYSPELIRTLHSKYASWVLILSEPSALLMGSCANGWVLAYGESANIIDWVYDVITGTSYAPIETVESTSVYQLLTDPSIGPLLNYMFGFNFLPLRSDHEELRPYQTGNGTQYWCSFLPYPGFSR